MSRYDVIPARGWKRDDGATASIYGAVPWVSDAERRRWIIQTNGWTVRDNQRGTIGMSRPPWPTREEAEAWVSRWS